MAGLFFTPFVRGGGVFPEVNIGAVQGLAALARKVKPCGRRATHSLALRPCSSEHAVVSSSAHRAWSSYAAVASQQAQGHTTAPAAALTSISHSLRSSCQVDCA